MVPIHRCQHSQMFRFCLCITVWLFILPGWKVRGKAVVVLLHQAAQAQHFKRAEREPAAPSWERKAQR